MEHRAPYVELAKSLVSCRGLEGAKNRAFRPRKMRPKGLGTSIQDDRRAGCSKAFGDKSSGYLELGNRSESKEDTSQAQQLALKNELYHISDPSHIN